MNALSVVLLLGAVGLGIHRVNGRRNHAAAHDGATSHVVDVRSLHLDSLHAALTWQRQLSGGEPLGNPRALLRIIEFADFTCDACRAAQPTLDSLLAREGDHLVILYRHDPRTAVARTAARAAACAGAQWRFRPYHDLLFQRSIGGSGVDWDSLAEAAGVPDLATFRACLSDHALMTEVQEDMALARRLRVTRLPAFLLGDTVVAGPRAAADVAAWVMQQRHRS